MGLTWELFVSKLRDLDTPYHGSENDFDEVVAFLKVNNLATDVIEDKATQTTYVLKELFDSRNGRRLDVSDIAAEAREADKLTERALQLLENQAAINGTSVKRTTHQHDVKVGRNRAADDPTGGFGFGGEFFLAVVQKGIGRETKETGMLDRWTKDAATTYGSESIGADGGFAVPTQFREEIMIRVTGEDSILGRTNGMVTSSNSLILPYDEDEPWKASGIQAEWSGEAGTMTQRKPLLTQKELKLRKLVCLVPLTEELMSDAPGIGSYVATKAADVIDFTVGEAIFRGTGGTQPLGFLNGGGLVTVTAEGSQVNQTLIGLNIIKMWARLYGPHRRNAVWFINQTVEPQLLRASIAAATNTGDSTYGFGAMVYQPANGLAGQPFNTLMGRPVIVTEHCEELGAVGDIVLAAMDQYVTLTKGTGIESATSMHIWFDQDLMALKFRFRLDGQPWSDTTIEQRDDPTNNTLGSFVTLGARE